MSLTGSSVGGGVGPGHLGAGDVHLTGNTIFSTAPIPDTPVEFVVDVSGAIIFIFDGAPFTGTGRVRVTGH